MRTIGVWAPILLIIARLLQGFAVGGEVGPATMFLLEAAPRDRRMLFASWQLASQNLSSLLGGSIGLLLGVGAVPIELERLGLARSVRLWRLDRPGRHLYSQASSMETLEKPSQGARATRPRFSRRSFARIGEGMPARSRAHQRGHDHPIFSDHHDALCDPHASFASVVGHARHDHARDHRLPRGARRRRPGRPLGPSPGRDRSTHCADDRACFR